MLRPRAPSLRVRALLALSGLLLPHAASGVKQSTILNQRRLLLGRVLHAPADDTVALSEIAREALGQLVALERIHTHCGGQFAARVSKDAWPEPIRAPLKDCRGLLQGVTPLPKHWA